MCGAGLGGGTITLSVILVRVIQRVDLARHSEALSDPSLDIVVGLVAGIGVAAFFGWRRSTPLANLWQRGVIAMLGVVGALIINFFLAVPADYFLGLAGLALLAVASTALGIAGSRWAVRGTGDPPAEGSDA
jgi:FtsH-binding integral membrane protein